MKSAVVRLSMRMPQLCSWVSKSMPKEDVIDLSWVYYCMQLEESFRPVLEFIARVDEDYFEELIEDYEEKPSHKSSDAFRLETHLEDFVINNMERIFDGEYELFIDEENRDGQQYPAYGSSGKRIGRIDILAKNKEDDSLLVIELKRDQSPDKTVSQVQRYMAWVKAHLSEDVRGLIICTDSDEKMEYALTFVKDLVDVKYYTVSFSLHDDPPS